MSNIFDILDNIRDMHKEIYVDDKIKRECKNYIAYNIVNFYRELSVTQFVEVIEIYKDCFKNKDSNIADILKSKNIPYILAYLDSNIEITQKIVEQLAKKSYDEDELIESLEYIKLLSHKYEIDINMYILKGDILKKLGGINGSIQAYREAKKLKSLDFTVNCKIVTTYISKYKKEISIVLAAVFTIFIAQYIMFDKGMISTRLYDFQINISEGQHIIESDNSIVIPLDSTININIDYKIMPFYGKEGDISYIIQDDKIAKFNDDNSISTISEGQTSLNVIKDNKIIHTYKIIVVEPKVESIELSIDKELHQVGDTANIQTEIIKNYEFDIDTEVRYRSTDNKVVVVDEDGMVEVVGAGKASIIATCKDVQAEEEIIISVVVEDINVEQEIELEVGGKHKLYVDVITNSDNKYKPKVMFSLEENDDTKNQIISMDSYGNIKAINEGTQVINITCGKLEKSVIVTVKPKNISSLKIENITETHEIIDENLIINLIWESLGINGDYEYDIYAKFKEETDFKLIGTTSKEYSTYSIEYDLSDYTSSGYVDIYVVGRSDDGQSQQSDTVNIKFFYEDESEQLTEQQEL